MNNLGFIRTAAAVPVVKVADVEHNTQEILRISSEASAKEVSLVAFPELSVTGYTCGDLFGHETLIKAAEKAVSTIVRYSETICTTIVVGAPVCYGNHLYNCAIVIKDGEIMGIIPKMYLPTYNEFYECRWFASGKDFLGRDLCIIEYAGFECPISPNLLFELGETQFAVELCEDLWAPIPPSSHHALAGAEIIVNLSASNEVLGKETHRKELIGRHSARTVSGYIYTSVGWGESTQDAVYAGSSYIYEIGSKLTENQRFENKSSLIVADIDYSKIKNRRRKINTFDCIGPDGKTSNYYYSLYSHILLGKETKTDFNKEFHRSVNPHPFIPEACEMDLKCNEAYAIQTNGLASRLNHIGCKNVIIGVSGGLDSTLALLVCANAFDKLGLDRKGIIGVTMPGYGTTSRTKGNALDLMERLGITSLEISINDACHQHFKDIDHNPEIHDVTFENSQARERTQILMDLANKYNGIVVGTGDLSELALGWATYNGDHMSMYGVNAGLPKTFIRPLVKWIAEQHFIDALPVLTDIIATPISPELIPADGNDNITQVTEDIVGPYELHDFFLYNFIRNGYNAEKIVFLARHCFEYEEKTIRHWLNIFTKRFFNQQFKRSCLPDGPKVCQVSLSPRADWKMPSDAINKLFML